jgi:hypothetical protein
VAVLTSSGVWEEVTKPGIVPLIPLTPPLNLILNNLLKLTVGLSKIPLSPAT